eukprot:scaffold1790_cov130-Isochrysis_galbana.AAC.2
MHERIEVKRKMSRRKGKGPTGASATKLVASTAETCVLVRAELSPKEQAMVRSTRKEMDRQLLQRLHFKRPHVPAPDAHPGRYAHQQDTVLPGPGPGTWGGSERARWPT